MARFQELSSPIPPFNEPPKTKAPLAPEPFERCRTEARPPPTRSGKSEISPTSVPDCKQPSPPAHELRATSGRCRSNDTPPQRSRPVSTREEGRSAKGPSRRHRDFCRLPDRHWRPKPCNAFPDACPRLRGCQGIHSASGQLLLSGSRKIPKDSLVPLQEFVASTPSRTAVMMEISNNHFNMK